MNEFEFEMESLEIMSMHEARRKREATSGYITITNMNNERKTLCEKLIRLYPDCELYIDDVAYDIYGRKIDNYFALCQKVTKEVPVINAIDMFDPATVVRECRKWKNTKFDLSEFWNAYNLALEMDKYNDK